MLRYACSLFGGGSDSVDAVDGGATSAYRRRRTQSKAVRTALSEATSALKYEIRKNQQETAEAIADWLADYLQKTRGADHKGGRGADADADAENGPEDTYTPRPYPFVLPKRGRALRNPPSAALFCDGTSNHFTEPTPTNIPILYSLVRNCFPDAMKGRCLYFRGVGRDGLDFVVAYSITEKLKEIYWATCRALWAAPPASEPLVIDVFGFSRGALLARAVSYLFLRFGAVSGGEEAETETETETDAARRAETEARFRARCDAAVDAFLRCDPEEKARFGGGGAAADRRPCVVRFLGLFDTVAGMSLERASELGALIPRAFLDGGGGANAIHSTMHLQAGNPTALFPNLSLYEPTIPNFSLNRAPLSHVRATSAAQPSFVAPAHYEYSVPGDHCNIGGGWDSLEDRMTKRSISNATLRAMLAASPYSVALAARTFPVPRSSDEWAADIRDSLACRPDLVARQPLPRAEALQLVARNLAEIRALPLRNNPPLSKAEAAAAKKRLKKNIAELLAISE